VLAEKVYFLKEPLDYHNTPELAYLLRPGLSIHGIMNHIMCGLEVKILLNKNSHKIQTVDIFVEGEFT